MRLNNQSSIERAAGGDEIGFRQTHETSGTWTIDSNVVILPHAGGEVTKVAGSTITVTAPDGTTATITVNAQTTYDVNGAKRNPVPSRSSIQSSTSASGVTRVRRAVAPTLEPGDGS